MRRTLLAALMIVGCSKHGDHVTSAARDLVPITVTTMLPGASPEEMASSVTTPLEHQLGQVSHLDGLHSRSTEGRSVIVAEFASGTDIDVASQEVQQALNASMNLLPHDLPMRPTYTRKARTGAVLRLTLASKTLPLVEVADVASSVVAQKLAQVAGVGEATVCGPEAAERITIDPLALAATGKTVGDVRMAIESANVNVPGGTLGMGDRSVTVATEHHSVDAFRELPIVRDTARIEASELGSCVAIGTGNVRVVAVTVTAQVGADPLEVRERLEAVIPQLAHEVPSDLHVDVWPRARPLAYEIELGSGMSLAARIDRLERAISALHLATRVLVQFGDADRDADLADLRIVPPQEHAKDVEDDIAPTFERLNLTVHDHRDHVVGFFGADPKALHAQAAALVAALATQKLLRVVGQLGGDDQARSVVTVDRDRAATLGVTASEIATTLRVLAPGGMEVSTVFDRQKEHRVMLAVEGQLRELFDQVMVRSTTGGLVPLSAVAKVTETREPTVIFHDGQVRWIGVRVAGSLDVLQDVLATLPVPQGVRRDVREPD